MKRAVILGAALTVLASPLLAHKVSAKQIKISCYRGPIKQVIWDQPNNIFIESLADFGYSSEAAVAIATRICRNPQLVDDVEAMKAETLRIIKRDPPRHRGH